MVPKFEFSVSWTYVVAIKPFIWADGLEKVDDLENMWESRLYEICC